MPREVRFVAEADLKRSASGKIIRRDMEAMLQKETAESNAVTTAGA